MKKASLFFLTIINTFSYCQELSKEELFSREKAHRIIQTYLMEEVFGKSHLVFSSGDKQFLILVEDMDSIQEFFINTNRDTHKEPLIHKVTFEKCNLMKKAFCIKNYYEGFIGFESEFFKNGYEIASGNTTYFAFFSSDGTRISESKLSFFVKPNPIDAEIYLFLTQRILENMLLD